MSIFTNDSVNLEVLRKKAFNYRWATHEPDVIPLTAADPDFPIAEPIKEAILAYASDGYFSYGPPEGLHSFKEAVANYYLQTFQSSVSPAFVLPVNSAAYGLFVVASRLLKPGENAIIPDPVDFLFRKSIEYAGATVRTAQIDKSTAAFDFDQLEQLVDHNTRAIFICNPNNPLGLPPSREHLNQLISWAEKRQLWIVSDEIWADIDYDHRVTSLLNNQLPEYKRKIVVSGLSKNYGLAGLRIGYIICPDEASYKGILEQSGHLTTAFGLSGIAQAAGTAALNEARYWLDDFIQHLHNMQGMAKQFFDETKLFDSFEPTSTYLLFPAFSDKSMDAQKWVEHALKEARVALVPGGKDWFEQASEGHVRLCYATSDAILSEALDRLSNWISKDRM
jgi:aspartate/methionine/tyrosine aminotransferase